MSRPYKDWISTYVSTFVDRTEAPAHLHQWTAIATIAGALTRRVWIDEVTFRFYPNLYTVIVAPPGVIAKSTCINLGIEILKKLEHINLAADNTTYPAFVKDLARRSDALKDDFAADDPLDHQWVSQHAITAGISEFGTFFKVEDEEMVNGLTDLYDCRRLLIKDTKTSGTDVIEYPCVNIIAGTTPSWVQMKLKSQIGGWGLSSRIIFVYADEKAREIARPSELWAPGEFDEISGKLTEGLEHIASLEGGFTFSSAANALFKQWYREYNLAYKAYRNSLESDVWIEHFLGRKPVHINKLAMIFSAARRDTIIIEEQDLVDAVKCIDDVESNIHKVFTIVPESTDLAKLEWGLLHRIEGWLQSGSLPEAVIINRIVRWVDSSTAKRIIENAVSRGVFVRHISGRMVYLELPQQ